MVIPLRSGLSSTFIDRGACWSGKTCYPLTEVPGFRHFLNKSVRNQMRNKVGGRCGIMEEHIVKLCPKLESWRARDAAGMPLLDPGCVKTPKGRSRRGIVFYRRCGFRVVLQPLTTTLVLEKNVILCVPHALAS